MTRANHHGRSGRHPPGELLRGIVLVEPVLEMLVQVAEGRGADRPEVGNLNTEIASFRDEDAPHPLRDQIGFIGVEEDAPHAVDLPDPPPDRIELPGQLQVEMRVGGRTGKAQRLAMHLVPALIAAGEDRPAHPLFLPGVDRTCLTDQGARLVVRDLELFLLHRRSFSAD